MEAPINNSLQILVANEPRLLRQMLSKVLNRPSEVNVIGQVTSTSRLPLLVQLLHPDWVVLTLCENGSFPGMADKLSSVDPEVSILGVTENGDHVRARSRFGEMTLNSLALDELVALIGDSDRTSHNNHLQ